MDHGMDRPEQERFGSVVDAGRYDGSLREVVVDMLQNLFERSAPRQSEGGERVPVLKCGVDWMRCVNAM